MLLPFSILKTNNRFVFSTTWKKNDFLRSCKDSQINFIISKNLNKAFIDYKNITKINDLDLWIYELGLQKISGKYFNNKTSGIIYTSGTTNEPKGVMLTSNGIEKNVNSVIKYLDLSEKDSSPFFTPTCYAYSLSQVLTHVAVGASFVPIPNKLLFPAEILGLIDQYDLTGISGTPRL